MKRIEFEGINSGDYESQCFDVDRATFIKLESSEPKDHDESYFNEGTYRYYPFSLLNIVQDKKYKITIEIEEVSE